MPHLDTDLQHLGEDRQAQAGAVVPPMHLSSLFTFESWDAIDAAFADRVNTPIYSRQANPTTQIVEHKLARLAGAERARLFASGMAAITAAVLHFVDAGDHVVVVKNVYGPANNLLRGYLASKMGLQTTFVGGEDIAEFADALQDNTRLIYLESPSSAVFSLQDIAAVTALARERGIATVIDNTWATPLYQRPLELGVDLEVHSVSKYLAGHSDMVAGVVMGSATHLEAMAPLEGELIGGAISPFASWLLLRSLRTFPVRMERHVTSARRVAEFLEAHGRVRRVRWPGLPSHPQYALACRQMSGFTGLMGFEIDTDDVAVMKRFVGALRLFQLGVSWGGHESLVYAPAISYLRELPPERFAALGISVSDIRISVGLEHVDDLIADLVAAFSEAFSG
ncbi:MAG: aminotransferase class I/II-fold pyridoxal phosphate-dependent enzyme [Rhodothermales bacterium]